MTDPTYTAEELLDHLSKVAGEYTPTTKEVRCDCLTRIEAKLDQIIATQRADWAASRGGVPPFSRSGYDWSTHAKQEG